jgi:hypothetical protein
MACSVRQLMQFHVKKLNQAAVLAVLKRMLRCALQ